jgi:hypothetical protein
LFTTRLWRLRRGNWGDRKRLRPDWLGGALRCVDMEEALETVDTNRQFTDLLKQFVELLLRYFQNCHRA